MNQSISNTLLQQVRPALLEWRSNIYTAGLLLLPVFFTCGTSCSMIFTLSDPEERDRAERPEKAGRRTRRNWRRENKKVELERGVRLRVQLKVHQPLRTLTQSKHQQSTGRLLLHTARSSSSTCMRTEVHLAKLPWRRSARGCRRSRGGAEVQDKKRRSRRAGKVLHKEKRTFWRRRRNKESRR